jgi:hypothetical protein
MEETEIFDTEKEIQITKEDYTLLTHAELEQIRAHNRACAAEEHRRGSLTLLSGIPKNCRVEQPKYD